MQDLHDALTRWVSPRVKTPEDAEDLVQDVFERLLRRQGDQEVANPSAFLWASLKNALTDYYRRRPLPHDTRPLDQLLSQPQASTLHTEVVLECVAILITQLPPPYKEALELTDLGSMTQREAAKLLGLSASGMKSRVQRARAMVLAMLTQCCAVGWDGRSRVTSLEPVQDKSCTCPDEPP